MVRAITARCRRSDLGGCADAPTIIWSLRVQQGWLAGHEAHPEADGESVRRIRDDRALLKDPRPSAYEGSATERFSTIRDRALLKRRGVFAIGQTAGIRAVRVIRRTHRAVLTKYLGSDLPCDLSTTGWPRIGHGLTTKSWSG
jgi:hypothetical protein